MRLILYISAFLLLTLPVLGQPGDTTNPYYRPPFVIEKIDAIHSKSTLHQDKYSFQPSRIDKDSNIYIHLLTTIYEIQEYDVISCKPIPGTQAGRTVNIKVDKTFSTPITLECMPQSDSMRIGISAAYENSNGDIMYIGHSNDSYPKIAFELRDADGNIKNFKTYGGSFNQKRIMTRKHPDGGFVVIATYLGYGDGDIGGNDSIKCGNFYSYDIWVFKTDSLGNMTHSTQFGSEGIDGIGDINILPNGEIFLMLGIGGPGGINCSLSGCTSNTTAWNNNVYDIMGVQLDANLNLLWSKCYGGSGMEHPHQIFVSPINGGVDGYWIASGTNSTDGMLDTIPQEIDNNTSYVWLFKINT